jgi:aldehyde:ferredoxin oxidoreductase
LLPKDDKLPKALNQPLPSGGAKGNKPDFDGMLAKYYEIREWDRNTGMPSENKLNLLDLP